MIKKVKNRFLKLPEFPGGKKQLREYIKNNLKYPESALKNQIEGTVITTATIDDNGDVLNVKVLKGLGFGCDEEAIRLVKSFKFGGVKNKGVRIKTQRKFKILFKLPIINRINYTLKNENKINDSEVKNNEKSTYTIKWE